MTEKQSAYLAGKFHAYQEMSEAIERAIKKNDGATTALQIINVFNEITNHVHFNKLQLAQTPSEQEDVGSVESSALTFVKDLNRTVEALIVSIEGGR